MRHLPLQPLARLVMPHWVVSSPPVRRPILTDNIISIRIIATFSPTSVKSVPDKKRLRPVSAILQRCQHKQRQQLPQ